MKKTNKTKNICNLDKKEVEFIKYLLGELAYQAIFKNALNKINAINQLIDTNIKLSGA